MRTLILTLAALLAGGAANAQPMTVASHSLSQSGATRVLQAAEQTAARLSAPSAIAVVNADGLLLAFIRMDDVRPAGGDQAIQLGGAEGPPPVRLRPVGGGVRMAPGGRRRDHRGAGTRAEGAARQRRRAEDGGRAGQEGGPGSHLAAPNCAATSWAI